jgi:hypothetical protein
VTDPLRPFARIIHTLCGSRPARAERKRGNGSIAKDRAPAPGPHTVLRSRLIARLAGVDRREERRMREAFVETVLLCELGDHLARDPGFTGLVQQVSAQLACDATLSARLHEILDRLAADARAPAQS